MKKTRMRVVVFGGSGFIGSHVADTLLAAGFNVAICDQRFSKYLKGNLEMLLPLRTITDYNVVEKTIRKADYVYNFAGMSTIEDCKEAPDLAVKINILGHLNILEACKVNKVKRVICASSLYACGKHGSIYGITKQTAEALTREYGVPYTILRYGSVYGERADENNSIYRYIKQALKGVIEYPGTGEEMRDYINVKDAAKLSVDILSGYENKTVLINGVNTYSAKEMLTALKEIIGNVRIKYIPKQKHHYNITPYSYKQDTAIKIIPKETIDIGEGLLNEVRRMG